MSDSETTGRCRREITAAYESTRYKPSDSDMLLADAIDRLAADVAAVKAKVDAVSPEDVAHLVECEKAWVRLVEEKETAAIRERDEARAEIEKLKELRDVATRLYGAEQAKVERLRKELEQRQPAGNSPKTSGSSPAAPQPASPAPGWLTDEEREVLSALKDMADSHLGSPRVSLVVKAILARAAPQPAAPPSGWLTDEERELLQSRSRALRCWLFARLPPPTEVTREVKIIDALLARAGSPPVVEVPELPSNHYARSEAERYRAALDKAGVAWREVPRG